ncbi:DUF305 domain-containing protein [Burkholderia multivorans]|jgi:uncharacterized protein (DUF305 family)|uniref:CopM family metallochaperone n=1 Tax=Burkholderia multivorans TaxID=87883 RepID=UPI001C21BDE4|nr:DUF305 domain-containing protein [Burkholderia multivorans]MBU9200102.1 DUF305 domain-containing protein [Burkholderia multivorans]MDN8078776.1 DUF305 domain-containing protein [Burkholderia multivorans]
MKLATLVASGLLASLAANLAFAHDMSDMPGPTLHVEEATRPAHEAHAATREFKEADNRMMAGMMAPYVHDADKDFVSHMLPHHEGAVEMAEIELRYGHDPKVRRMAAQIIQDQRAEMAFMKHWQEEHRY